MKDRNGIRLKIDVTPAWWKAQAEDPECFAKWCVKAVRLILGTWPRAEIRLSREKVCAVVSFDGETRAGLVHADKMQLREALDQISEPEVASDRKWFDFPGVTVEMMQRWVDEDPDLTYRDGVPGEDDYVQGDVLIVQGGTGCRVLALNDAGVLWIQKQLEGR